MPFPLDVRNEALVRSGRRCCVCRQFKGLGIEVHHIHPEADGGANTLENAIALCFDCHMDAGHYNPKHPRGTKFSPEELRRHRDQHWSAIAEGRIPVVEDLWNVHVRHLICLNYDIVRAALNGDWGDTPFAFDKLATNAVGRFMRDVLDDAELPSARHDSIPSSETPTVAGGIPQEEFWESFEALVASHPEFATRRERPLKMQDFGPHGVHSGLLRACVNAGCDPASLGRVAVEQAECGGPAWSLDYRVRRPIFVFTELWNKSDHDVLLVGSLATDRSAIDLRPQPVDQLDRDPAHVGYKPLLLEPGQAVGIPSMVLLSPFDEDRLTFRWMDTVDMGEEVQYGGNLEPCTKDEAHQYLIIGPIHTPSQFELIVDGNNTWLDVHEFDMSRAYAAGRDWMIGSCPHVFIEHELGGTEHIGEIFYNGRDNNCVEHLVMPSGAKKLHIAEIEFERSLISSARRNGQELLSEPVRLKFGDVYTIDVSAGDQITLAGKYSAKVPRPRNNAERRGKRSLVGSGVRSFRRVQGHLSCP